MPDTAFSQSTVDTARQELPALHAADRAAHFATDAAALIAAQGEPLISVRDGAVHATVSFDGGRVWVGSIWISRPPSEDVLDQSIELQRSLIQRMHRAVPALPSEEAWATEWVRMEAQQGAAAVEPERRGQGSPTQRTTRGE